MRRTLFLLVLLLGLAAITPPYLSAQTAAPKAAPRSAPRPVTLTIQVTDAVGAPLADAQATVTGPVAREGVTTTDGSLRFTNMRPGAYRLRFEREGSVTLEREITIRAGESPTVDVSLTAAPPPLKAPEPVKPAPEPTTTTLPPPGDPKVTPVPLFLEKNFIGGREGRKDSSLGCAATAAATLHQLRDTWSSHMHDDADEWIYVVAGEGTLRIGTADQRLQAGTFSLVPHSISHAVVPQGRNPLIVISVLSGPRCQG
jgi:mannose-6-phosphate isomerase-like protein (cupin superfamily)